MDTELSKNNEDNAVTILERFTAVSTLSANLFPRFELRITLSTIIEISCFIFLFIVGFCLFYKNFTVFFDHLLYN